MCMNQRVVEVADQYIYSKNLVGYFTRLGHKTCAYLSQVPSGGISLDLGCGRGCHFPYFKNKRVIGVDNDPEMLKGASKNLREGITLAEVDISKGLPYEADTFDSCIASGFLEHVKDLTGVLIEVKRLLKPGGELIVLQVSDGLMYQVGRHFTTKRYIEKNLQIDYLKYLSEEHVNSCNRVLDCAEAILKKDILIGVPFSIPWNWMSVYIVGRYTK
jgi:SAM-dependent methyltransferase